MLICMVGPCAKPDRESYSNTGTAKRDCRFTPVEAAYSEEFV